MCKHILIQNFQISDIDHIKKFSSLTYDRDGYGAIIRTKENILIPIKSLDIASFYIDLSTIINSGSVLDVVVHHRTSTNGKGLDYSHPFEFQGNFLTHNGVVNLPEKHDTKTTNDSEQLLHHLIKSDFETKSIQGYFSCFILNERETTILVDAIAPIFTDGRIFCSHQLEESFQKITLEKLIYRDGLLYSRSPIQVTESSYGLEKSHLSLGYDVASTNEVDDFLYCLTTNDEYYIVEAKNKDDMKARIKDTSSYIGIELTDAQIEEVTEYFYDFPSDFSKYKGW